MFIVGLVNVLTFHFPAHSQEVLVTLSDLLDKPRSQVSSLPPLRIDGMFPLGKQLLFTVGVTPHSSS